MRSLEALTYRVSRFVSILIRKVSDKRNIHRQLRKYNSYLNTINQLPAPEVSHGKLLIIRLDGIGDYLLFRNFLALYQSSPKWKNYHITLLGEQSWKNIYDTFDSDSTDETIWINKHKYLNDESYRNEVYSLLRQKRFEVVICPCRTRPFLVDDLLVKATGAFKIFGVKNTYKHLQ